MSRMQSPDEYLRRVEDEQLAQDIHNQKQRPPHGRSPWRWVKHFLLAILLIVMAALAFAAWFGLHTLQGVSKRPYDLSGLQTDSNGRTNVLVLGVGDPGHAGLYHSQGGHPRAYPQLRP